MLAASKQQAAFVDVQTMDDEVERVLGWRCAPGAVAPQTVMPFAGLLLTISATEKTWCHLGVCCEGFNCLRYLQANPANKFL